jgi:hypothetical protein
MLIPNCTALALALRLAKGCWNPAEKKPASGSAVRRWLQEGSLVIDGERISPDEMLDYPIWSVVLFPKSNERRVTLW